jgi:hypothetical protein
MVPGDMTRPDDGGKAATASEVCFPACAAQACAARRIAETARVPPPSYREFRRGTLPPWLHEGARRLPAEALMQAVWRHQRLRRSALRTADGRRIRVLHPGFWSREGGPDFQRALIQLDDAPPHAGDVEVDATTAGWHGHGHDASSRFAGVILHVVWELQRTHAAHGLPVLALEPHLDAPLAELEEWFGSEAIVPLAGEFAGRCNAPLRSLDAAVIERLLLEAARTRLELKAARLAARAKDAGWEQSLWEALFTALGYKRNTWPMLRLAELLPELRRARPADVLHWQARLFGLSGLLPDELTRRHRGVDEFLRQCWDIWWRERDAWETQLIPRAAWNFAGLRPPNQPHRRIALAAAWLAEGKLIARIESWLKHDARLPVAATGMVRALAVPPDTFWSRHVNFNAAPLAHPLALLGLERATDLAINAILPWLHARAGSGRERDMVMQAFLGWPASGDNALLKLARGRLLGGVSALRPDRAALQQGLLQIVRDFCDHSNAACDGCRFPELVRQHTV